MFNLELFKPFSWDASEYVAFKYKCESRKEPVVIVCITNFTALIAFDETYLSEDKINIAADLTIKEFAKQGISVQYEGQIKPITENKLLYDYLLAVVRLEN